MTERQRVETALQDARDILDRFGFSDIKPASDQPVIHFRFPLKHDLLVKQDGYPARFRLRIISRRGAITAEIYFRLSTVHPKNNHMADFADVRYKFQSINQLKSINSALIKLSPTVKVEVSDATKNIYGEIDWGKIRFNDGFSGDITYYYTNQIQSSLDLEDFLSSKFQTLIELVYKSLDMLKSTRYY